MIIAGLGSMQKFTVGSVDFKFNGSANLEFLFGASWGKITSDSADILPDLITTPSLAQPMPR